MRRIILVVFFGCLIMTSLLAQAESVTPRFKLLEAEDYSVDIYYSSELQILYCQVYFTVPAQVLADDVYWGLFLPKTADFQSLTADGKYQTRYGVKDLSADSFVPPLHQPELLEAGYPASFNVFKLKDLGNEEDISFRLWYNLPVPPFTVSPDKNLGAKIAADQFWYPRNISQPSKVNIVMTTPPYITLLIGNNFASHTDGDYFRTHRSSFLESAEQPVSLFLIRD